MNEVQATILAAVVAALLGYLTPFLVRRLPEPPEKAEEEKSTAEKAEGPKELYVVVADLPWFASSAMAVSGVAAGLVGWTLGMSWLLLLYVPLVPVVVALSIVDLRTRMLPRIVLLPALAALLVGVVLHAGLVATWDDLERGVVAMAIGYAFYFVLWFVYPVGLGYGDVRLAALLSLALGYLGWPQFLVGMYSGFLLLGVPGLVLAIVKLKASYLKTQFPFGPFMAAGSLLGLVLGTTLL